jgi:KipI family sensor histidine kinase inhibitor
MDSKPEIRRVAPHVTEFVFDARIDPLVHEQVLRLADALDRAMVDGIEDIVIAYHSLGVRTRPDATERLQARWPDLLDSLRYARHELRHHLHTIPVAFDGEDLADVARFAGMSEGDVVRLFCETDYRVYMSGFLGGFPYLASVPEPLRRPRRETPRPHVKAGTVALAGEQAGIYRVDSPGGWNLLGRTEIDLDSLVLRPGDRVRFKDVSP